MSNINYPDILGLITDGVRCNMNVVQLALATRPRVVRAGRPFEALLLVQNAADVNVDVTVNLKLPPVDANKVKEPFKAHTNRLVVGVCPAEVGYIRLPILSDPTTAVHADYKLGVAVQVKPLDKPQRIRQAKGGGAVDHLNDTACQAITDLQNLHFATTKHFGKRDTLEVNFSVLSSRLGRLTDLQPGWVSLWTMADYQDDDGLFEVYAPLLAESVLPKLKPQFLLEPLRAATLAHFAAAGYPLAPIEALFIAKMLMRVLQRADPVDDLTDYGTADVYNVLHTIESWQNDGAIKPVPHWCNGLLHMIAHNRAVAQHVDQAFNQSLYFDLVRDAIPLAHQQLAAEMGPETSQLQAAEPCTAALLRGLQGNETLDFEQVYHPLLLGGLLAHNHVYVENERLDEALHRLQARLEERATEQTVTNQPIFDLAHEIAQQQSQQFHFPM